MVIKHKIESYYNNSWSQPYGSIRLPKQPLLMNLYCAVNCLGAASTRLLWLMRTLNAIELISVTESLKRQLSNKKYR